MIQIIKGTFGYYNGRKIIPITNADGPQKFDPELEARLVKQKVAKYVDLPVEYTEHPENPDPAGVSAPQDPVTNAEESDTSATGEITEYSEDMKLDELKEVAARYGVDASALRKKVDVIAAIEKAKAGDGQSDDDEEPPQLDAADPV